LAVVFVLFGLLIREQAPRWLLRPIPSPGLRHVGPDGRRQGSPEATA
jgi:hypothetical protein